MMARREQEDVIIRVRDLKNGFGEQIVHEGLDLEVRRGEILGVVGGSGTGKSVLMRSIIGLQTPIEGSIEVFGENTIGREETDAVKAEHAVGALFPKKDWVMLSHHLIWHGRRVCHAKKPACGACTVAKWCPSYGTGPTDPEVAAALVKTQGPA